MTSTPYLAAPGNFSFSSGTSAHTQVPLRPPLLVPVSLHPTLSNTKFPTLPKPLLDSSPSCPHPQVRPRAALRGPLVGSGRRGRAVPGAAGPPRVALLPQQPAAPAGRQRWDLARADNRRVHHAHVYLHS